MKGEPFFSVLVTVYNKESSLRECLDSILGQSFDDYEIIAVDDGSADKSGDILDEYAERDKRIKVCHTVNSGVFAARMTALKKSSGKYVLNIDADDLLKPTLLKEVADEFLKTDCDMVFYDFETEDAKGKRGVHNYFETPMIFVGDRRSELFGLLLTTSFNSLWMKCFKREIANVPDENRFFGIAHGEDLLQSAFAVCASKKTSYICKALYLYRESNGASGRFDKKSVGGYCEVIKTLESLMKKYGFDSDKNVGELSRMCRKILDNCMRLAVSSDMSFKEKCETVYSLKDTFLFEYIKEHPCGGFSKRQDMRFKMLDKNMSVLLTLIQSLKRRLMF